jgi:hypothetical protein
MEPKYYQHAAKAPDSFTKDRFFLKNRNKKKEQTKPKYYHHAAKAPLEKKKQKEREQLEPNKGEVVCVSLSQANIKNRGKKRADRAQILPVCVSFSHTG